MPRLAPDRCAAGGDQGATVPRPTPKASGTPIPATVYLDIALLDALASGRSQAASTRAKAPTAVQPGPADAPGATDRWWHFYAAATKAGQITEITALDDLAATSPGDLVEVTGPTIGNPLISVLDFVAMMLPLVIEQQAPAASRGARSPGSPQTRGTGAMGPEDLGMQKLLAGVVTDARDGLRQAPILDVVLAVDGGSSAVISTHRSILRPAVEEQLRDSTVRVVGKVISVIEEGGSLNLFRRCALGASGAEASRDMLAELADSGLEMAEVDPVVEGPAIDLMPIAIIV